MKTQIVAINNIPGGKIIEGVERKKTVGECSGMVGGEQHSVIESWTGGALYVNRKETSWGQGDMVVER